MIPLKCEKIHVNWRFEIIFAQTSTHWLDQLYVSSWNITSKMKLLFSDFVCNCFFFKFKKHWTKFVNNIFEVYIVINVWILSVKSLYICREKKKYQKKSKFSSKSKNPERNITLGWQLVYSVTEKCPWINIVILSSNFYNTLYLFWCVWKNVPEVM